MRYWDYYPRYTPARPKAVKDGLRTRKKAGEIGETWWAKRFLEVLNNFGWSNRLGRGRSYARKGQVIDYNIDYGIITSKVQGTQRRPYSIKIQVKTLSDKEWAEVIKTMSQQARFSAKLLAGQMPHDIEKVFEETKVSLFPTSEKDFVADCSCPDWANPCKHIAAVYYIVGEAFDRDPFLIFHLRGLKKDELLEALNKERGSVQREIEEVVEEEKEAAEPIACDPAIFWKVNKEIDYHFELNPPPLNAAILHRLGVPQFWMGTEKDFYKTMEKIYKDVSNSAIKIAYSSKEV
ncbi:MAG: SWIM zinc finger family protein [bacterium]